jgi:hypothetical protein
MENVIRFPGAGFQKVDPTPDQVDERAKARSINQASGRAHAARIRSAVEKAPFMKEVDRRRAAESLWEILALTEQHGIRKARVLHAGRQGVDGDSTKRLPRYALDPSLSDEKKNQRAGQLVHDGRRYLRIAEAAGQLMSGDKDRFVARLFGGTSIGVSGAPDEDADSVDVYTEFADMIREIARGITRKNKGALMRVFKDIEEYRIYQELDGRLRLGDEDWGTFWANFADGSRISGIEELDHPYYGYCRWSEPEERVAPWRLPYPNLRIGWGMVPQSPNKRVWNEIFTASREMVDADGERSLSVINDEAGKPIVRATFLVEVRLGLLPVGAGGTPEPVFITRPWTVISFNEQLRKLCVPGDPDDDELPEEVAWPWLPSEWQETDCLDRWGLHLEPQADCQRYEMGCAPLIGKEPALEMPSPYGVDDEGAGVRVDLVSAASCRAVLEFFPWPNPCVSEDERDIPRLVESEKSPSEDSCDYICRGKENTLARVVEENLFLAHPDRRLDTLLDQACDRVAADVAVFLEPLKTAHRRKRDEILRKWRDGGSE